MTHITSLDWITNIWKQVSNLFTSMMAKLIPKVNSKCSLRMRNYRVDLTLFLRPSNSIPLWLKFQITISLLVSLTRIGRNQGFLLKDSKTPDTIRLTKTTLDFFRQTIPNHVWSSIRIKDGSRIHRLWQNHPKPRLIRSLKLFLSALKNWIKKMISEW